jgi:hypothetical protein
MASSSLLALVASLALLSVITPSACFDPTEINYNASEVALNWMSGSATWYGAPTGAGADDNGTFPPTLSHKYNALVNNFIDFSSINTTIQKSIVYVLIGNFGTLMLIMEIWVIVINCY